ncbi:MAG: hypothetical protein ACI308_07925 [Muribaculaceae bacterium]
MTRLTTILLTAALLAVALSACNSDDEPLAQDLWRYDVVTYKNYSQGMAYFTYVPRLDAQEIDYQGAISVDPNLSRGTRVLLSYYLPATGTQSPQTIKLNRITRIISDSLRYASKERIDTMASEQIRLASIWRTGNYLNLHGEVEYTGKSRWLYLLMDKATWNADTVECYLVHNTFGAQPLHWQQFYVSTYVGAAWQKSTCKAIRVHLNDCVFPNVHSYTFGKQP